MTTSNNKRDPKTLVPHPRNAEIYGENEPVDDLVQSVRLSGGILDPILIDQDNHILSGHRRVRAAIEAGLKLVLVQVQIVNSEDEALQLILEHNRQRTKTNWQLAKEAHFYEHLEKAKAKKRQSAGGKGQANLPDAGQTRDRIGRLIGKGGTTAERLLMIHDAIKEVEEEDHASLLSDLEVSINKAWTSQVLGDWKKAQKISHSSTNPSWVVLKKWKEEEWDADRLRHEIRKHSGTSSGKMNIQKNDSIDWARFTWNPVTGCKHGCKYCYAEQLTKRAPYDFSPTIHPARFDRPAATPLPAEASTDQRFKNVFVCSMADLFGSWVPQEWIQEVLKVVREQHQWDFLFLTKYPKNLLHQDWPGNSWVGASVDSQKRLDPTIDVFRKLKMSHPGVVRWVSFEPLTERVETPDLKMLDAIVIGGQSAANGQPKICPEAEWVTELIIAAKRDGCKVFVKTNTEYRPIELPRSPSTASSGAGGAMGLDCLRRFRRSSGEPSRPPGGRSWRSLVTYCFRHLATRDHSSCLGPPSWWCRLSPESSCTCIRIDDTASLTNSGSSPRFTSQGHP